MGPSKKQVVVVVVVEVAKDSSSSSSRPAQDLSKTWEGLLKVAMES